MHFTENHLIYLTFRILLTLVAIFNAIHISQSKKPVTLKSFIPIIIAYTLYAGLRWGRGIDYNIYYWVYKEYSNGTPKADFEPLFALLIKIFVLLGLEWKHLVFAMSFLLAVAGCIFLKQFRKGLVFILPFFFLKLDDAENLQRWYMAFSFVLMGCPCLLKNHIDFKKFVVFALLGFLVHYGIVLVIIPMVAICYFSRRGVLSPWISAILYFFGLFFFSPDMMGIFTDFVSNINIGVRFASYQADAEGWLTGSNKDYLFRTASFLNIIPSMFLIFVGYSYTRQHREDVRIVTLYHWTMFSVVFLPIAIQIELLGRIESPFTIMQYVFMAIMAYDILISKIKVKTMVYYVCLCVFVYYAIKLVMVYPLSVDKKLTYYIWDSEGRNTQYITNDK